MLFYLGTFSQSSKAPKKGKKGKPLALNVEQIAQNQKLLEWRNKYRVTKGTCYDQHGVCKLPVKWVQHPESCIEARERNLKHLNSMYVNIQEKGVLQPNICVVMWLPDDPVEKKKYENHSFDFDITADKPPYPMYTIIGDHTTGAIQMLNEEYPMNRMFQYVPMTLLVLEKTEANIQNCMFLGNLDNTVQNLHKGMSMWDCVKQMHNMFIRFRTVYKDKKTRKQEWASYRTFCETTMPFKGGTFSTLTGLAKHEGKIWSYMMDICSGKVKSTKKTKFKIPESVGHFQSMSDIPEKCLIQWLQAVVDGNIPLKDFAANCKKYKLSARMKSEIVESVSNLRPEHKIEDWQDLIAEFPEFNDRQWFLSFVNNCTGLKVKDPIPPCAKVLITELLSVHDKKKAKALELQVSFASNFFLVYFGVFTL